jgi:hypothetical protein
VVRVRVVRVLEQLADCRRHARDLLAAEHVERACACPEARHQLADA